MPTRLLTRGSWSEAKRVADVLRTETVGGVLLLAAAGAALVWANSPWSSVYHRISEFTLGPESLHLHLSLSAWAADGLLAIFFFVIGLELKREFVAGDLRDPARAALPIAAAVGGMIVPAAMYIGVNLAAGHPEDLAGWAVPIATDIAFALAVLAVISTHLPTALRTFLLTLAVVDDLLAITVIAVFYTEHLSPGPLALALIPGVLFGLAVQRGVHRWWILLPLAAVTWALVHASGVHATVAGVLLGFTVPVTGRARVSPRPSSSNTGYGRSRPGSRCRCSRSSPQPSRWAGGRGWATPCTPGHGRGDRRFGGRQTHRRVGNHMSAGHDSPARGSTTSWPGVTCSGWRCWAVSASRCRC